MDPLSSAGQLECVQLNQLPALTTLLVWTTRSWYRFVVVAESTVWVQGGAYFAEPAPAQLTGAALRNGVVLDGLICIGLNIELDVAGLRFRTSPVVAMIAESAGDTIH
jgi:hypothetical protein